MTTPAKIEGAVPKKVYMHYEEGEEETTLLLKMTLPSKWAGHTVDYLKEVRCRRMFWKIDEDQRRL